MAERSTSSSDYAPKSNDEKLVALDSSGNGPSGIMREAERSSFMGQLNNSQKEKGLVRGDKRKTRAADRSSFMGPLNNSQKEKGLARVGVKRRTRAAERSSLMGRPINSRKEKGFAIISGAGDFDEITGGKVATPKNLGTEISHMVGLSEIEAVEMDGVGATSIECGCCYWEYLVENMVHCRNGHRFCFKCITKRIDEIIYGGLKAHASLSCMAIDYCEESIPLSEIKRALPNDVIERYEYRQAQETIVEAKIEGLVYCPFCNIPYEVDKCVHVLDCPNPKCLKASCIQCKKLSHLPLRCEEAAKKSETALRREIEERMTKAVIRECNICQAELIKAHGCNKLRCVCGNTMCYVCRRTISYLGSDHFCGCFLYSGEPGKPCQICNKCSLIENEIEDNEAFAAREEALRELVHQKPELLHQEIGPPLKTRRRHPSTEEQGHHVQRFPPPEVNEIGDQLANMVVLLPQFLRPDGQIANLAEHPPLPPPQFFRFGDQFANMDVPLPHFFRFDGGQFANMSVHPTIPSPQLFRLHGQLENMAIPPQLPPPVDFFQFGDQLENIAVPPPLPPTVDFFRFGDQFVNMAVAPQLPPPHFSTPLPSPELFRLHDQLENMAIPPPLPAPVDLFRFGDQNANIAVQPQLSPPHFYRIGNVDQLANMALQQELPPPHFSRIGNGDQLSNMAVQTQLPPPHFSRIGNADQLANMAVQPQSPPPHFFRIGNGDQLRNVAIPPPLLPPHSFRFGNGDPLVNMVVPPLPPAHLIGFADNMNLHAQHDHGRHLQAPRLQRRRTTNRNK